MRNFHREVNCFSHTQLLPLPDFSARRFSFSFISLLFFDCRIDSTCTFAYEIVEKELGLTVLV